MAQESADSSPRAKAAEKAAGRAQTKSGAKAALAVRAARTASYAVPGLGEAVAGVQAASAVAGEVGKVLTADLAVIRRVTFREVKVRDPVTGKKRKVDVPTLHEYHVNPLSLGIGVLGAALGAGVLMVAWNGVTIHSGIGNSTQIAAGIKDSKPVKWIADSGRGVAFKNKYNYPGAPSPPPVVGKGPNGEPLYGNPNAPSLNPNAPPSTGNPFLDALRALFPGGGLY